MIERCLSFGGERNLVGLLGQPAPAACADDMPGVLLWNAGALHRVGPQRMNVELARRLADLGVTSLRFDLSGLGDSVPRRSGSLTGDRAVMDVRDALDCLEKQTGVARAVVIGLCSGADNAHRAAMADLRVCGAVVIDGYMYPTLRCRLLYVARFFVNSRRIRNLVKRVLRRVGLLAHEPGSSHAAAEEAFAWTMPPRRETEADIQSLVDRGVQLLYVFSGQYHQVYNHAGQFGAMYPGLNPRGRVEAHFFDDCDHTFSQLAGRRRLIGLIAGWISNRFSGGNAAGRVQEPVPCG